MAKILFLQRDSYEVFGVMYLSAYISQKGYRAEVLIEAEEGNKFLSKIAKIDPDIVAFSLMSGLHEWAAEKAAEIKRRFGYHIIAGGPHCTFFPEFIENEGIDAICRGEGEDALLDYLSVFSRNGDLSNITGFWIKTNKGIIKNDIHPIRSNLDTLPPPDRDIYRKRYYSLNDNTCCEVLVARGCPYDCFFCYNQILKDLYSGKGNYVRRHSVERVINEIKNFAKEYSSNLRWISFIDDLFIMDKYWLKEFLINYKREVALPFGCGLRANLVDEELISMLAQAGCKVVSFGIESGDSKLRNEILNKNISEEQIISTGKLLNKYSIRFSTFNMFNLPGETLEMAKKTIYLNLKIRLRNYPWSGLLQPYRGTKIFDLADKLGMIAEGETGANLFNTSTVKQKDTGALTELNAYFYWIIRFPRLISIFMWFIRHPVKPLSKVFLLLSSFHRYICLIYPFEGNVVIIKALKSGLKRIKAYI